MFYGKYKTYSKELVLSDVPTKEILEETYKKYKFEGPIDFLVTTHLHYFALRKLKNGFIDRPGTYKLSVTVKLPIMFWHKIHTKIEQL